MTFSGDSPLTLACAICLGGGERGGTWAFAEGLLTQRGHIGIWSALLDSGRLHVSGGCCHTDAPHTHVFLNEETDTNRAEGTEEGAGVPALELEKFRFFFPVKGWLGCHGSKSQSTLPPYLSLTSCSLFTSLLIPKLR